MQRAFEACVGEGIEYLSHFIQTEDEAAWGTFGEYRDTYDQDAKRFIAALLASSKVDFNRAIAWAPIYRLLDGAEFFFPLDVCYRRSPREQDFAPPLKLSTGCAAGTTVAAATLRAILELLERMRSRYGGAAAAAAAQSNRAASGLLPPKCSRKRARESRIGKAGCSTLLPVSESRRSPPFLGVRTDTGSHSALELASAL